ncbi:1-acyl-sn-glycerol-3-phosphate acyltransferase [Paraferrimonas sedimenticola]|uniref:Acyltransferase n=1 Tax=Paraferrimonas sedimenticola TaxID=375674 RepID=A0AA37W2H7_9GAMM|nr:1-acyl-sn-glycerol-3-phosphate acyltransferase [Paraferrimonas sedimenticola]GLP97812.1 acyltransferase [Paraferrimonas sedimenticola]
MMRSFCQWLLARLGWRVTGQLPEFQFVMIVGPHSSNWDFIIGIIARFAVGRNIHFIGKHQLFIPPWGWLFRAMGGYPVNRAKANNLVESAVELYASNPEFCLALAPEGTRSAVTRWKTGFYHIAKKAKVPIVCVGLDFGLKQVQLQAPIATSDDMSADMNRLLDYFRSVTPKYPKDIPSYQD